MDYILSNASANQLTAENSKRDNFDGRILFDDLLTNWRFIEMEFSM